MKGSLYANWKTSCIVRRNGSYTIFHLEDGKTVTVSRPLAEYETMLIDTPFFRVHKSFLINLHHVKEYQRGEGGTVIMSNKAEIEVSRRKDLFLARIGDIQILNGQFSTLVSFSNTMFSCNLIFSPTTQHIPEIVRRPAFLTARRRLRSGSRRAMNIEILFFFKLRQVHGSFISFSGRSCAF